MITGGMARGQERLAGDAPREDRAGTTGVCLQNALCTLGYVLKHHEDIVDVHNSVPELA